MSEDITQNVDALSTAVKEGLQAGPGEDTKKWDTGNQLGQELKREGAEKKPVYDILFKEPSTPLFMRDSPEGDKENAQDEKDEMEE